MLLSRNAGALPVVVAVVVMSGWLCAVSQACSCAGDLHPQQAFCGSDVAMRVQLLDKTTETLAVTDGNNYTVLAELSRYKVNVVKVFKGDVELIQSGYVYSPADEANCALDVEPQKRHYLLTARIWSGMIYVTLCNFVRPWNTLSSGQKYSLTTIYGSGCMCQISSCHHKPCPPAGHDECVWTDPSTSHAARRWGPQAKWHACLPGSAEGTCQWSNIKSNCSADPLTKVVPQQRLQ